MQIIKINDIRYLKVDNSTEYPTYWTARKVIADKAFTYLIRVFILNGERHNLFSLASSITTDPVVCLATYGINTILEAHEKYIDMLKGIYMKDHFILDTEKKPILISKNLIKNDLDLSKEKHIEVEKIIYSSQEVMYFLIIL